MRRMILLATSIILLLAFNSSCFGSYQKFVKSQARFLPMFISSLSSGDRPEFWDSVFPMPEPPPPWEPAKYTLIRTGTCL